MPPRPAPSGPVPFPGFRTVLAACLTLLFASGPVEAQNIQPDTFPLRAGEAVASCFSEFVDATNPAAGIADQPVLAVVDTRDPLASGAVPGEHWDAPTYHNEQPNGTNDPADLWTSAHLGQVFGVALSDGAPPDIYVTATTTYAMQLAPGAAGNDPDTDPEKVFAANMFADGGSGGTYMGPGGVHRIDGVTGAICEHAKLDNSGPGLGNVAFDRRHDQIFVSNFEDGKIVRLPAQSPCGVLVSELSSFDHGSAGPPSIGEPALRDDGLRFDPASVPANFNGAPGGRACPRAGQSGFTQLGRRVWGLQVHANRLYYSVWSEHQNRGSGSTQNEIWSVGLASDGDFVPSDVRREVKLPAFGNGSWSNPVADIAFAQDGRMLLSERGHCRDFGHDFFSAAHRARVWDVRPDGSGSFLPPVQIPIGNNGPNNAAGGVDFAYGYSDTDGDGVTEARCDETVWATGDALRLRASTPPRNVYGLQGITEAGASHQEILASSFYIDLDGDVTSQNKNEIGDVEVVRSDCLEPPCLGQVTFDSLCVVEDGEANGDYTWRFRLRNETEGPVHHLFLSDLLPGVSADPEHIVFDPPIPPGGWARPDQIAEVTFTGVPAGATLEPTISIHDDQLVECCAEKVTVELPDCECAQVVSETAPGCFAFPFTHAPGPPFRYRVALQNLSGRTAQYLFAAPVDPVDLVTPIPPDDLRVRGSRALVTPAAPGGTTGSFQFLIDGPDARPGQEVCLLLSLHDSSFDRCCAIPRCFKLPDCSIDLVDPHWNFEPYDSTILGFDHGELVLSGFGAGVGGIDVEIPGADLFQIGWAPIDPVDGQGAEIKTASFGPEGLELARVEARELGGTVEIQASFLQRSRQVEVELLDADGAVIASRTVGSHRAVVSLDHWPVGFVMQDDLIGVTILGHDDVLATLPGGAARRVSAVRVRPVDRSPRPPFASVALRVAGLDELRLRALAAAVDCDGDGVPDAEAVEHDPSLDLDGDGVPDSCRDDDGGGHPGKPAPDVRRGSAD